jgi:hypothetical protein
VKDTGNGTKYKGGKHGDTAKPVNDGLDSNHSPAKAVSPLKEKEGPAFQMEPEDHRKMSSTGSSKKAKEWRKKQEELIEKDKFKEAQDMDIEETKELFGDKYDKSIEEMQKYTDKINWDDPNIYK